MKAIRNKTVRRVNLFIWIVLLSLVPVFALFAYATVVGASASGQEKTELTSDPGGSYLAVVDASVQFDGSASFDPESAFLTYAWNFGDGTTGAGATPTHRYSTIGIFDVCLTVNNGAQESEPVCTDILVFDPSTGVIAVGR
jgi:hypothetical protein